MINQLKADYYKLTHSLLFKIIIGVIALLFVGFLAMSRDSEGFGLGFAREYVGLEPIVDGFVAFAFDNPAKPTFWEVVYSAVFMTFFLWIVLLILTVQFFSKEFTSGTIKLSYANGKDRFVIFMSKLIVITTFFGFFYYLFNILAYLVATNSSGYPLTAEGIIRLLQLTTLFFLVLVIFTMMSMVIFCIVQNPPIVTTIMIAIMYSTFFIILCLRDNKAPLIVQIYFYLNPMYYLWKASGFWAYQEIVKEILIYFTAGFLVLGTSAYYLMENKEIK